MTDTLRCPDGHVTVSTDYCDVCGLPMQLSAAPPDAAPATAPSGLSLGGSSAAAADKTCPNCQVVVPGADLFCENCGYDFTTGQLPEVPVPAAYPQVPVTAGPGTAGGGSAAGPATAGPAAAGSATAGPAAAGPAAAVPAAAGSVTGLPDSRGPAATAPGQPLLTAPPQAAAGQGPAGPVPPVPAGPLVWVAELWVDPDWFATQESEEACPSSGMPQIVPLRERSLLIGRVSASRNIHPQLDCGADHGVSRRHAQLTSDGQRWWVEDLQSSNGTFVGVAGAPLPKLPIPAGQRTEFAPGDRVYVGAWTRLVVRKATADET